MEIINSILASVVAWIQSTITAMGPWGIALLMAIESCNIPLPSEAILPFAGFMVSKGIFSIHTAAFFGAIGCVLGSIPSYLLGSIGGRPFIEKYGKYFSRAGNGGGGGRVRRGACKEAGRDFPLRCHFQY